MADLVPDTARQEAIVAAANAIGTRYSPLNATAAFDAMAPIIVAAVRAAVADETLRWCIDELHREARWQKEQQMRGMFANGERSIDRLLMLIDIFEARREARSVAALHPQSED